MLTFLPAHNKYDEVGPMALIDLLKKVYTDENHVVENDPATQESWSRWGAIALYLELQHELPGLEEEYPEKVSSGWNKLCWALSGEVESYSIPYQKSLPELDKMFSLPQLSKGT